VAQRCTKEAQRSAEVFGWGDGVLECWGGACLGFLVLGGDADVTDLTDARGFVAAARPLPVFLNIRLPVFEFDNT